MKTFNSLIQNKRAILLLCFILSFLAHLPFINLPPRSIHVWRQCNTLAVARNFYLEDMNILKPRVDRRLDTDGVTGMQFPSYEYLVAIAYQLVGEHNWVHRLISLLISFFGIVGMYSLTEYLSKSKITAAIAACCYTWSPELFYFGFGALPDILASACSVWGLFLFLKWFNENNNLLFLPALFFVTLAGLTKLQFLAIGFPIAVFVLRKRQVQFSRIFLLSFFGVVSVAVTLSWYFYAAALIKSSGLADFGLAFKPVSDLIIGIKIILRNLISDFPELLLGYATTILTLIGLYFFYVKKLWKSTLFLPLLIWFLSLVVYYFIELAQMRNHPYYLIPFLPLIFLLASYGGAKLYETKLKWLLVLLLICQPILAGIRIVPSRWLNDPGLPAELYEKESQEKLTASIPANQLSIVGPDISGCIYFYFLKQKGFGFSESKDLFTTENNQLRIENYMERGAKFLISNDATLQNEVKLKPYIQKAIAKEGDFYVFELINLKNLKK